MTEYKKVTVQVPKDDPIWDKVEQGIKPEASIGGGVTPHDPISIFKTSGALEDCVDIQQDGDGAVRIMISADGQKNYVTFETPEDLVCWFICSLLKEVDNEGL